MKLPDSLPYTVNNEFQFIKIQEFLKIGADKIMSTDKIEGHTVGLAY